MALGDWTGNRPSVPFHRRGDMGGEHSSCVARADLKCSHRERSKEMTAAPPGRTSEAGVLSSGPFSSPISRVLSPLVSTNEIQ